MSPITRAIAIDQAVLDGSSIDTSLLPAGPAFLRDVRERAVAGYNRLGIPGPKHEEWRFTSLRPLTAASLRLSEPDESALALGGLADAALPVISGPRLVFIDGRLRESLCSTDSLPRGVTILPLRRAFDDARAIVHTHLARHAAIGDDAFAALDTALFADGALVHIAKGASIEAPITIVSIATRASDHAVLHPRALVVAEESSSVTIVEDYVSPGGAVHLTNAVTEVIVGPNADVRHCMIERESESAFHISNLTVVQQRDSRFSSHSVLLGGSIVRNNVNPILEGEGGHGLLNGIYVGRGNQHLDNHMRVEHRAAHCDSRQYYRGIMSDDSHGVFTGRIIVSRGAQKTDAVQSNQNLLLSATAQAQTRPQLEIYADDVKCTHGATIGKLDEDALFYLKTRGLSPADARALLVYAFTSEMLARIEHADVRAAVTRLVLDRLPQSAALTRAIEPT